MVVSRLAYEDISNMTRVVGMLDGDKEVSTWVEPGKKKHIILVNKGQAYPIRSYCCIHGRLTAQPNSFFIYNKDIAAEFYHHMFDSGVVRRLIFAHGTHIYSVPYAVFEKHRIFMDTTDHPLKRVSIKLCDISDFII